MLGAVGRLRFASAMLAVAFVLTPPARPLRAQPPPAVAPVAQLGIQLPSLGGWHWFKDVLHVYFTPAVMADIRDNLHATYVRTGWIPDEFKFENIHWKREDEGMDAICSAGLKTMIVVPNPQDDAKGLRDLVAAVRAFFARYTQREFGCVRYAEITNEADLSRNGFDSVEQYAKYYELVAPIVASFGVTVITSGTSGKDLPWTAQLAQILRDGDPPPPVDGYGFHPYGVAPDAMAQATMEVRRAAGTAAGGVPPAVYVTEIGQENAADLYRTIVDLGRATPAITIYEYLPQPGEDSRYGLKNDPARYRAVQMAWEYLHRHE
jgi:hypothetical protein